eukprot:Tbor_TRINITY_DN2519_c0_g1::TRINITY_DN2519_c0_g1_i1::g.437::m.437
MSQEAALKDPISAPFCCDIPFRSVAESRLSNELIAKQGQWDEEKKAFRSKESQLQERSRCFHKLHQVLRFTTTDAYEEQGKDINFTYPMCLRDNLRKSTISSGDIEDPNLIQINRKRKIAAENRALQNIRPSSHVKEFENELRSTFYEYLIPSNKNVEQDHPENASASSPTIRRDESVPPTPHGNYTYTHSIANSTERTKETSLFSDNNTKFSSPINKKVYSSTLAEMKGTKSEAERLSREFSIINSVDTIFGQSTTQQLKSTVTEMFANPDKADEISKRGYEMRERQYEETRQKSLQHQADISLADKMQLEQEVESIRRSRK